MKKNKLKGLFIILIFTFMLCIFLTVDANTVGQTHNITIKGAGEGHTFEIYQVFTGNLDSETNRIGDVKWGTGINKEQLLLDLKSSEVMIEARELNESGDSIDSNKQVQFGSVFSECETPYDIVYAMTPYQNDSDVAREFAQIIGKNVSDVTATAERQENGDYVATGLITGYYFIKDANSVSAEAQTRYILNLTENQEIAVKGDAPTIDLKVKKGEEYAQSSDYQIGDTVEFEVVGKLPNTSVFNDYKTYKYIFHDTLPKALQFNESSVVVKLYKNGVENAVLTDNFVVSTSDEITIGCDNIKKIEAISTLVDTTDVTIVLTYNAKLVGTDEKTGKNVNTAYLQYSDDPNNGKGESTSRTLSNNATVYTYTLNIEKVNGKKQDEKLNGVGFKLYTGTVDVTDNRKWAQVDSNGKIIGWVDNEEPATILFTKDGGKVSVYGLDNETYALKEVVTLDGYNTMNDKQFTIASVMENNESNQELTSITLTIKGDEENAVLGTPENCSFNVKMLNYPGGLLPATGGMGTVIFYIVGGTLIAFAFILIIVLVKRKKSN